ncbi:arsinothricin resistance N-acetyltransferase ArsN1 family B [Vibrio ziniensis]|uniref:N-acetyltransferase n=1 Tax=Vibrio ziniensis TaxID=2711221 RepID=A0A6G7CN00_9VIBR|nr:arsinothricin resistance N-acetyltransferase ArsN1 family B [Vibrio ziniensis]QIH43423.1 N-acetyltransferase [Vibrio ziniensis]
MVIRNVTSSDIPSIVQIYNHYIATTTISFEEIPVTIKEMEKRVEQVLSLGFPWIVLEQYGEVKGYAYANQWKARSAYRFTVEPSIYVDADAKGKGLGKALYGELLEILKRAGYKNAVGSIALPNQPSVALHERMGFKKVGEFNNIGFKFDHQISVGYWQLELNNGY